MPSLVGSEMCIRDRTIIKEAMDEKDPYKRRRLVKWANQRMSRYMISTIPSRISTLPHLFHGSSGYEIEDIFHIARGDIKRYYNSAEEGLIGYGLRWKGEDDIETQFV